MDDVPLDGMRGNEEVYGNAIVGGNAVKYHQIAQKKRITGLRSDDEDPVADLTVDGTRINFAE